MRVCLPKAVLSGDVILVAATEEVGDERKEEDEGLREREGQGGRQKDGRGRH